MTTIKATVKKWGNSMGIIIPKEVIATEKLKEGDEIELHLMHDSSKLLSKMWNSGIKIDKTGQQIKDELRRDLYDD